MHRYVDLHYQYLTSSLCMYAELSNFIKAICHPGGHWSWAWGAQGQTGGWVVGAGGGLCHRHPYGGKSICPLLLHASQRQQIKAYCFIVFPDQLEG